MNRLRKYFSLLTLPLALIIGCTPKYTQEIERALAPHTADAIARLSDEFDNPKSLSSWRQAYQQEGWNADQLQHFDIGRTQAGKMTMIPYASTWYKDYRGVLAYKMVSGDFVATTRLQVNRRGGQGAPRAQFSLAGVMVRTPRNITPQTWEPGQENYVFLSLGAADSPGRYQLEVKTTVNSDSQLRITPTDSGEALLRVARIGSTMILLQNTGRGWSVHQRYSRSDFPAALQVGLTCYTDWPTASSYPPRQHNSTVIKNGNPDLAVLYDYVRYRRPALPASLRGKRLDDPQAVSDQELLRFLGAAADE